MSKWTSVEVLVLESKRSVSTDIFDIKESFSNKQKKGTSLGKGSTLDGISLEVGTRKASKSVLSRLSMSPA